MASVVLLPFQLLLLFLLLLLQTIAASTRSNLIHPSCPPSCGNVSIPYPFGIGPGCYRDESFRITCKENGEGVLMPYTGGNRSTIPVYNFSVPQSQATMLKHLTYDCYNTSRLMLHWRSGLDLTGTPFAISAARNKFTAIGCNTIAYIAGTNTSYKTGCMSYCNKDDVYNNITSGSCTGTGCCQAALTENLRDYGSGFQSRLVGDDTWVYNPCSYSFVADQNWFKFNSSYLEEYNFRDKFEDGVPLVLDWTVGDVSCEEAKKNSSSYACRSSNSTCRDAPHGPGYTCNCSEGYEGNPYLENGCEDIDECSLKDQNPCPQGNICTNIPGSYNCSCNPGYQSKDPYNKICVQDVISIPNRLPLWVKLTLGITIAISSGLVGFLLSANFLYQRWKEWNAKKIKEKHFHMNRGLLLQQLIPTDEHLAERTKIFSLEELQKATYNFDDTRILGKGGHGTVYKGILSDQRIAAIKKANIAKQKEIDEFINEVVILSQISHRNVVRLFGCCLESEIPLLVYEFVSNGTLKEHLEGHSLSWEDRLRIAIEASGALAHLHHSTSISIFHRDVKSSNILLDDNCISKISDFGASRTLLHDQSHLTTAVQGTFGYLDPEYCRTGQLTEKSDVYSFGVILVELLTGEKPVMTARFVEAINIGSHFLLAMREDRLFQILDERVKNEGTEEELTTVAMLAKMCLRLRGEERPTMKEVEMKLEGLRSSRNQKRQHEYSEQLPGELSVGYPELVAAGGGIGSMNHVSMEKELMCSLNLPR